MRSVRGPGRAVGLSSKARRAIDELNKLRLPEGIPPIFASCVQRALAELENTSIVSNACIASVTRIVNAVTTRDEQSQESHYSGEYLLHTWQRSDALNRLLGGALDLAARFALVELATIVCIEHSWEGRPSEGFAPLREPWWLLLNAVTKTKFVGDAHTRRWQEIIAQLRKTPVEGAPQNVACALAWAGLVDVDGGDLYDEDFARAAGKERRWFTVSRGFGLRLLGQLFLFSDAMTACSQASDSQRVDASASSTPQTGDVS